MTNSEREILTRINRGIGSEEERGDWKALRDRLVTQELRTGGQVPLLAFRRASGACVDARAFLDAVSPGPARPTEIKSITAEGDHLALVRCVVEMGGAKFDNFRVFVRADSDGADWRLLAWANEPQKAETTSGGSIG